jgi:hypothetical protein
MHPLNLPLPSPLPSAPILPTPRRSVFSGMRFPLRRLTGPAATLIVSMLVMACDGGSLRDTGVHADGTRAWERRFVTMPDGRRVPHGPQATWYEGGARRSLEFYEYGARQGYAFTWNEAGDLVRLRACEADFCEERTPPARARRAAMILAEVADDE